MKTLSALLLLAASVAAVSASPDCSYQSSANAEPANAKELNEWAANVVADVVHAGMTEHSKHGAEGWVKSYQHSLAPAGSSGPELRVNQVDKASLRASALGVSPTVCKGLCTAADVACKLACKALPGFLQGACKAACGLAITACNGACTNASARPSTATDGVSIKLPKFLVTTVEPKSQVGDKFVFNSKSAQNSKLPVFLVDVKYEGKASVAGRCWAGRYPKGKGKKWTEDEYGLGEFSGTAVSQVEFTSSITLATALTLGQS
tara:strand:- start:480 stop:1268 length:789 start_codon:yes stop_codon:yes gene_type:complete